MIEIRAMIAGDWPAVRGIYAEGIATGHATFETAVPGWEKWDGDRLAAPRLVARVAGEVVGFAVLSAVSTRPVYAGVAEVSVYVAARARGQGAGRALMTALIEASELAGLWTLQGGVFPENRASLTLLGSCGFRIVGRRERLGRLDGRWRDVLLLERRSARIGAI